MRIPAILTGIALATWIGGGSWYWVCQVKGHCDPAPESTLTEKTPPVPQAIFPGFRVESEPQPLFGVPENFRFGPGSISPVQPQALDVQLDQLAHLLKQSPDTDLEITGWYLEREIAPGGYLNLGLARAEDLASRLLQRGVSESQLVRSYSKKMPEAVVFSNDSLIGGADFRLVKRSVDPQVAAPKSISLYFDTGSDQLAMNDTLRTYLTEVIQYLRTHPDTPLRLTGHTDNTGTASKNLSLGLGRAKTVAAYFEAFGLEPSRIRTDSKGMKEPVAPNDTESNRQRNRRVDISIN